MIAATKALSKVYQGYYRQIDKKIEADLLNLN